MAVTSIRRVQESGSGRGGIIRGVDEHAALDHRFPPDLAELSVTRRLLRHALTGARVDGTVADDLLVVASELVTNAIRHAGTGLCRLLVRFERRPGGRRDVVLEVTGIDRPAGVSPFRRDHDGDPLAEGGRGMVIVRAVCDDLEIEVKGNERVVRCRKSLAA